MILQAIKVITLSFATTPFWVLPTIAANHSKAKKITPGLFSQTQKPTLQSIQVVRTRDNKVLFSHDATTPLRTASVMKLVTSAAILETFGPQHRFTTTFAHTGTFQRGKILGDLYIVGGGDPIFTSETMWQVAADLKNRGIDEITGDLIIDNHLFAGPARDASRQASKASSSHAYDAPVTSFGINFNTFPIVIAPADHIGQPGRVNIDPYWIRGVAITNRTKTISPNKQATLWAKREFSQNKSYLVVGGGIPLKSALHRLYRFVGDPIQVSGEIVRSFLGQAGLRLLGHVQAGKLPSTAKTLVLAKSKAVSEIIRGLHYFSNNYIADVLISHLGIQSSLAQKSPTSITSGNHFLETFLSKRTAGSSGFRVVNGSGLNPNNRLSAAHLTAILVAMAKNERLFPEYMASLPTSGESGSLLNRFRDKRVRHLRGHVRAKTGSMSQPVRISSLAGYLHLPKHGLCAFAIIQNGKSGTEQPRRADLLYGQENGLAALYKYL